MAALKYKDKDGFWQELQVGTNVVANPMLTGTEQELTSLQVGNTKYKSSGGKLYKHQISFYSSDVPNTAIDFVVFSTRSTAYTLQEVATLFGYQPAIFSSSRGEGAVMCSFVSSDGTISAQISGTVASVNNQPLILLHETYNDISL